jgi:hypothetical protein
MGSIRSGMVACAMLAGLGVAGTAIADPVIRAIPDAFHGSLRPCLERGKSYTVVGYGFGVQAGKGLGIGGGVYVELPVSSWSDGSISFTVPDTDKLRGGARYYVAIQKADGSAWLSNPHGIRICE